MSLTLGDLHAYSALLNAAIHSSRVARVTDAGIFWGTARNVTGDESGHNASWHGDPTTMFLRITWWQPSAFDEYVPLADLAREYESGMFVVNPTMPG